MDISSKLSGKKNMPYGHNLRLIRDTLGLTQAEISEKLGIKQSYYSNMEQGKKGVSANVINMIFNKLNISPSWFFNNIGEMFSPILPERTQTPNIETSENISLGYIPDKIKNIEDYPLGKGHGITDGRDFKTDYEINTIASHIDFTRELISLNNAKEPIAELDEISIEIHIAANLLDHYSILGKTLDAYSEFFNKQISKSSLIKKYKEALLISKQIHELIIFYKPVINEFAEKLKSFNEANDRLYCFDEDFIKEGLEMIHKTKP